MAQLFFGVGTGRVATMALANALSCEPKCLCLHEGKLRHFETPGQQFLPFLTLQNRLSYEHPERAEEFVEEFRSGMAEMASEHGLTHFGDIAYNYAPLLSALHRRYADAKFIFLFRDCLGFVRSCTAIDTADDTPVGWAPRDKPLGPIEKYIALGRWQPRQGSLENECWEKWDYVAKNIWLWAETNRVIIDALATIPPVLKLSVRFEDFQTAPVAEYARVREFLALPGPMPDEAMARLTQRPINKRIAASSVCRRNFNSLQENVWLTHASPIRKALGYE